MSDEAISWALNLAPVPADRGASRPAHASPYSSVAPGWDGELGREPVVDDEGCSEHGKRQEGHAGPAWPLRERARAEFRRRIGAMTGVDAIESYLVELLGRYSNLEKWVKKVDRLHGIEPRPADCEQKRTRTIVRRLSACGVDELVAAYAAGATVYELAVRFGVHRVTGAAQLHRRGVAMRGCGLTETQVSQAAALYAQGWPVAQIGRHFGVDGTTVWRALRAHRVPMRKPWERS